MGAAPTSSVVEAKLVSCRPMSPTVLRVERCRFFFFSNEGHELPHVHAQDGDKLAKLWLEPVVLAASTGFAPRTDSHPRPGGRAPRHAPGGMA